MVEPDSEGVLHFEVSTTDPYTPILFSRTVMCYLDDYGRLMPLCIDDGHFVSSAHCKLLREIGGSDYFAHFNELLWVCDKRSDPEGVRHTVKTGSDVYKENEGDEEVAGKKDGDVGIMVDLKERKVDHGEKEMVLLNEKPSDLCFEAAMVMYFVGNNTEIPERRYLVYRR